MAPDRPRARTEGLVIKTVADELLVYDLAAHRAHSLNKVAAVVWRLCDGTRDMTAITAAVFEQVGESVPVEAARYAIHSLGRAGLLAAPITGATVTRRDLISQLGTAAAVVLPLVTTVTAPPAAQAASCIPLGQLGCTTPSDCCTPPPECLPVSCVATRCLSAPC